MYAKHFRNMILFAPYNHKRQILLLPLNTEETEAREMSNLSKFTPRFT